MEYRFNLIVSCLLIGHFSNICAQTCPSRCLCFRTTVRCMFLQLNKVPDELPVETTILDLRFNRIREIPSNTFRHLRHLNTLLLNNNHLTSIGNNAFVGLKELRYLYLYKNRIQTVDRHAFRGLPKLEQLYIHFNRIESFAEETFFNLPSLERLFLHNNRVSRVPKNAFQKLDSLKRLRLDSNALVCDCEMLWLAETLKEKHLSTQSAATCQFPTTLQGKSLMTLEKGDFRCKKPKLTHEPNDVEISFGGTAYFYCRAEGEPNPEIVWLHNSNEISMPGRGDTANNRYSVLQDGTLMITQAQDKDQGVYECMAKNTAGEVKSRPAKMRYNGGKAKPHFIEKPQDRQLVSKGSTVILKCQAGGQPLPEINWTFLNAPVSGQSSKHRISDSGTLTVSDVQQENAGSYRCIAANVHGRISVVANIQVGVLPTFEEKPADLTVLEGDLAEFKCFAEGNPVPQIIWTKDGRPIVSVEDRITILHLGTALRIREVESTDQGTYTCTAKNIAGEIKTSAILAIKILHQAPRITKVPVDAEVKVGSGIEIPCRAEGEPRPVIAWRKDGSELDTTPERHQNPNGHLYIFNVKTEDQGTYECFAKNRIGSISATMTLTVKSIVTGQFNNVNIEKTNTVFRTNSISDRLIVTASLEASGEVERAINQTLERLFDPSAPPSPNRLFKALRFPSQEGRDLAKAAEIYDRTVEILHKHVVEKQLQANSSAYNYEWLSSHQLQLIANLSGCLQHNDVPSCDDMCFHKKYRTIDGTCNNLARPWLGAALTAFYRHLPPVYENGLHLPMGYSGNILYNGFSKPNPRTVSTQVIVTQSVTADPSYSHMLMQWGQFLDHDLDFSLPAVSHAAFRDAVECIKSCDNVPPCFPIPIPEGDVRMHNRSDVPEEEKCIEFIRSSALCGSGVSSLFGDSPLAPREQVNQLTSFIDASQIYGSTDDVSVQLRNFSFPNHGLLRVQRVGSQTLLPPANDFRMDCQRGRDHRNDPCFLAGDVRANEQLGLLSMHTLWVREHNRVIRDLRDFNPHWDGDTLYYETRKILGAQMQHITFTHWLPKILGPIGMKLLGDYTGYDPSVNPSVANVFATAALRFGHTLINPILTRLGTDFKTIPEGDLPLHKAFFAPHRLIDEGGIDPLLRGLFYTPAKIRMPDQLLNNELINGLFTLARTVALDLAAINIQRGRDHAIPTYNAWRRFCNMSVAETFDDLKGEIKSADLRNKLRNLYGHPDNIDVWVGGVTEELVEGSRVGPTFLCLIADQFKRSRSGDRFWYENPGVFTPQQLTEIRQASLSKVLCDNGDNITMVTKDVFSNPSQQTPNLNNCRNIPGIQLSIWAACCHDCASSGVFSSVTRVRGRTKRSTVEHSYVEDKPINASRTIKTELPDLDVTEIRVEGLEEIMMKLHKTIRQLSKKVNKLESKCGNENNEKICISQDGYQRKEAETWKQNKCVTCVCQNGQITCYVEPNCQEN